jgi:hypothetical protein
MLIPMLNVLCMTANPATGWMDRLQARCPDRQCNLSWISREKWHGDTCPNDLSVLMIYDRGAAQIGDDFFSWDEYVTQNGGICVRLKNPQDTSLYSNEADLLLGLVFHDPGRRNDWPKSHNYSGDDQVLSVPARHGPTPPIDPNRLRPSPQIDLVVSPTTTEWKITSRAQTFILTATIVQSGRFEPWPSNQIYWVDDEDRVLAVGKTYTLFGANARNGEFAINVGVLADGPFDERIEYVVDIMEH